jgi:hypothetical protein
MEQLLAESVAPRRFQTLLFGLFATLALIGLAMGLAAALAMTRVMKNLLFQREAQSSKIFPYPPPASLGASTTRARGFRYTT